MTEIFYRGKKIEEINFLSGAVDSTTARRLSISDGRGQIAMEAAGTIAESFPAYAINSAQAPTTQAVIGALLGLRAGDLVTGVCLRNQVAAAGTAPTKAVAGLASSGGSMLAVSADVGAAANWPLGVCLFPFTTPYTVTANGGFLAMFLVNGTWGTTQPTPGRIATSQPNAYIARSGYAPVGFVWTGQTDLPAIASPVTITSGNAQSFWIGVY